MIREVEFQYRCDDPENGCGHTFTDKELIIPYSDEHKTRPWLYSKNCPRCDTKCEYIDSFISDWTKVLNILLERHKSGSSQFDVIYEYYYKAIKELLEYGRLPYSFICPDFRLTFNIKMDSDGHYGAWHPYYHIIMVNLANIMEDRNMPYKIDYKWTQSFFQLNLRETILHEMKHWFDYQHNKIRSSSIDPLMNHKGYVNSEDELSANIFTTVDILQGCLGKSLKELEYFRKLVNEHSLSFSRIGYIENYNSYVWNLRNTWRKIVGTETKFPIQIFKYLTGEIA